MRHPSTKLLMGAMDEMLWVWMEKHMGGVERALHLDEQPMKLSTPQCVGKKEKGELKLL
jgi:hypothetical protein